MTIYVSCLRGINVSGHNKIRMAELRAMYESLELQDVRSYLQSGNVVFRAARQSPAKLAEAISSKIAQTLKLCVPVLVREAKSWKEMIEQNPFARTGTIEASYLHVTLLDARPASARLRTLTIPDGIQDECKFGRLEFYLHCPNGCARTKLTNNFFEKQLDVVCTTRNWKTATQLNELAGN